jgi:serine/threonine protein phosphatase PrpC
MWTAPLEHGDHNHREVDLGAVAGVCDRGVRHETNEDAMGLAVVANALIAVVCDGVSTTPGSGQASAAAAATATAVLADAVRGYGPGRPGAARPPRRGRAGDVLDVLEPRRRDRRWNTDAYRDRHDEGRHDGERYDRDRYDDHDRYDDGDRYDDEDTVYHPPVFEPAHAEKALYAAVAAAQATIIEVCSGSDRPIPSCTFAAAIVVFDGEGTATLTVGWIGDSRIYLLGPRWCERVSADDTWAAEAARAGIIPQSEAETHRRAHTLTRWIGGEADDVTPHVATHRVEAPATVVVCSDGLWNYASRPDVLATLVAQAPGEAALDVARHLTQFSVDRGGHDNITVVAARIGDFGQRGG